MATSPTPQGMPFGHRASRARRNTAWLVLLCVLLMGGFLLVVAGVGIYAARSLAALDDTGSQRDVCTLSGDDQTVVFVAGSPGRVSIYRCDLATHHTQRLAAEQGTVRCLALAPDQRTVAYVQRTRRGWEAVLLPAAGGAARRTPLPRAEAVDHLAWATDSSALYLLNQHGYAWRDDASFDLWCLDPATATLSTLYHGRGGVSELTVERVGRYAGWLRWEVETSYARRETRRAPHRANLLEPATGQTALATEAEAPARATLDGRFVLHTAPDYGAMRESAWQPNDEVPLLLWLSEPNGRATSAVWHTTDSGLDQPRPAADGKAVLVRRHAGDDRNAWRIERIDPADGRTLAELFDAGLLKRPESWRGPTPRPADKR